MLYMGLMEVKGPAMPGDHAVCKDAADANVNMAMG